MYVVVLVRQELTYVLKSMDTVYRKLSENNDIPRGHREMESMYIW